MRTRTWVARTAGAFAVCAGVALSAASASADNGRGYAKCKANESQVVVYISPDGAKTSGQLGCGEQVQVLGRERGFIQIRSNSGATGYILADALSTEPVSNPAPAPAANANAPAAAAPGQPAASTEEDNVPLDANEEPAQIPADYVTGNLKCTAYFAAYGLSPVQYKWITNDAHNEFPGICAAKDPHSVDYVVVFTHDSRFYLGPLPEQAVHTSPFGLSYWTPLNTLDTSSTPSWKLDKARTEYVWVFGLRRGTYNPATFPGRLQPGFETSEYDQFRISTRAARDAFRYIQGNAMRLAPAKGATALGQ